MLQYSSRAKTHNLYMIGDYKVETDEEMKTSLNYRLEDLHR